MTSMDSRYRQLWDRMKKVVDAYTARERVSEADYCMADFFLTFDNPEELERHVAIAEESAREAGVI